MHRRRVVGLRTFIVAAVAAAGMFAAGSGSAAEFGPRCSGPKEPMEIDKDDYGQCVRLRPTENANAFTLTEKSDFATRCPVTIQVLHPPVATQCKVVTDALRINDAVRINEWPGGKFELSIVRNDKPLHEQMLWLEPIKVRIDGENADRTIGYRTEVEFASQKVLYQVYVSYRAYKQPDNTIGKPIKFYSVEVFEDTPVCRAEIPATGKSKVEPCENFALRKPMGAVGGLTPDGENPSGGGGEPPPKPR